MARVELVHNGDEVSGSSARSTKVSPPTRLGLYMFTPMIGGAEAHLKDLLHHIDRRRFDVTLFYDSWPEFDAFLEFDRCPPLTRVLVAVAEPGGHYGAKIPAGQPGGPASGLEPVLNMLRRVRRAVPSFLLHAPGRAVGLALRYGLIAGNLKRLREAFLAHPVDVLHIVNGGYPGALTGQVAALAARQSGCRRVIMSICSTPFARKFPQIVERELDRRVAAAVDLFLVPAADVGAALVARRGVAQQAVRCAAYGVADATHEVDVATRLGPPGSRPLRVVMVASFQVHKGHRFLVEALHQLASTHIEFEAILVGGGPLRSEIEALVRARRLESQVRFTGFVPSQNDVFATMASADLVVLPSEIEGLPYVVLQAMSLGKAVVASAVGGVPEAVQDNVTGLLVPPGDAASLAAALSRFACEPTLTEAFGAAARRKYCETFTLSAMVARYQAAYEVPAA